MLVLAMTASKAKAQYFCFWIANQSSETFAELKIREYGTGTAFSKDLLPQDLVESGGNFWVKTGNDRAKFWDVQITDLEGNPILFTYKDTGGKWHRDQRFITVNAKDLHTLVIEDDPDSGELTFKYYLTDQLALGHPCEN
jgi:hypothetical protein